MSIQPKISKAYWFKILGRVYATDKEDAEEQVQAMAKPGVNCDRASWAVETDEESLDDDEINGKAEASIMALHDAYGDDEE